MLKIKNLEKNYKNFNLNMTFDLEEGCIMGLIGKNGSGKTTLISTILNIIVKDGGSCMIFGTENNKLTPIQREDIGIVFDEIHFPDNFKIYEIEKFCSLVYKHWDTSLFRKLLADYEIEIIKEVSELSKGMKMKLQLAVAFSHNPKLLILDEATSGLDPIVRDELLDSLFEFVRDGKHSILMSSHILSDIEKISDIITYIDNGKLIFSEYKDDLLEKYCIVRGDERILNGIAKCDILGVKQGHYGIEACINRNSFKGEN